MVVKVAQICYKKVAIEFLWRCSMMDEIKKEVKKTVKRKRKPNVEKRVATIDAKIAALEAEKEELLRPLRIEAMLKEAAKTMTLEEIAAKLDVPIE